MSDGSPASPDGDGQARACPAASTYGTVALKRSTSMMVAIVPGAGVIVPASNRRAPSEPKTADAHAATPPGGEAGEEQQHAGHAQHDSHDHGDGVLSDVCGSARATVQARRAR